MVETILFISPTGTMDNGAEISVFNLMKLLVSKGYRVLNAFPDYHLPIQDEYRRQMENAGVETFGLSAVKWWWEEAPGGLPGSHYERIQGYKQNISDLQAIIQAESVDLVISNTVNVFQGALAAANLSVPHFWLIHEFSEGEFAYYREKLTVIDDLSDQIFAVAGALQDNIKSLLPERDIKSFIPYSHVKLVTLKSNQGRRLVQVGRVTDNKNQLELLKAYKEANLPHLPLVFIGAEDEAYAQICKDYIEEQGLHNVHFLGYRDNPWKEVGDNDICVFTSKVETFGMVYIEALLYGIPTIVSNNKGYQSVKTIFGKGETYSLGDVKELSQSIKEVLENFPSKKQEMLTVQEQIAAQYTPEKAYQDIVDAIASVDACQRKNYESHMEFLKVKVRLKDRLKVLLKRLLRLKKLG